MIGVWRKKCNLAAVISLAKVLCCDLLYSFYSYFFLVPYFWVASRQIALLILLKGLLHLMLRLMRGYYKIDNRKREVLTLIDFSRPSTAKRLFVFDMRERKVLFSSVVSHGKNSGDNYATSFSNEYGSYKSSLGFYLTESTYQGKNGYSLILNGLEKGINDRARERAIVMHGAAYADPSVVSRGGRLGRSFGCPAVPQKLSRPIIDAIKGGSVMYIYAETPEYLAHSSVLKGADGL